ncbi:MAG TPA: NAD-dependent epimerase/dehydratase family protein, partial [Elusimicrobiota bacterium]|nr:NAD-dependent epimerase/dehydratase family protein [Elusimicrobiota bacterium]
MRAFVTGATGYVGGAVARAFRRRGHRVAGLTRSAEKGRALAALEIEPAAGDMQDPASYAKAARAADVLVHCAAEYSAHYEALDRRTLDSFLALTEGSRTRTIVYTSGVWQYGATGDEPVDETAAYEGRPLAPWRSEHERMVLKAGGLVIQPGCVYGLSGGLTGAWFEGAYGSG